MELLLTHKTFQTIRVPQQCWAVIVVGSETVGRGRKYRDLSWHEVAEFGRQGQEARCVVSARHVEKRRRGHGDLQRRYYSRAQPASKEQAYCLRRQCGGPGTRWTPACRAFSTSFSLRASSPRRPSNTRCHSVSASAPRPFWSCRIRLCGRAHPHARARAGHARTPAPRACLRGGVGVCVHLRTCMRAFGEGSARSVVSLQSSSLGEARGCL